MIDRAGLEIRYTPFGYRGFESLTLRKAKEEAHHSDEPLLLFYSVLERSVLQLFKCTTELIRTGCAFSPATDTIEFENHIVDLLSANQLADTLQIAITATQKEHLLNHIVLISGHINQLGTSAVGLVLYVLRLHKA